MNLFPYLLLLPTPTPHPVATPPFDMSWANTLPQEFAVGAVAQWNNVPDATAALQILILLLLVIGGIGAITRQLRDV